MRKRQLKYPSELNTTTIRINVGTYALLKEVATKHNLTIAEALDQVVTGQAAKELIIVPRTQIPMPTFAAKPKPILSVNGDKHIGFAIRPKGGRVQ